MAIVYTTQIVITTQNKQYKITFVWHWEINSILSTSYFGKYPNADTLLRTFLQPFHTYQTSTFSEHGSFLMTSGAIQATVPAKLILVLISFHCLLVPKSLILTTSFRPIRTLKIWKGYCTVHKVSEENSKRCEWINIDLVNVRVAVQPQ